MNPAGNTRKHLIQRRLDHVPMLFFMVWILQEVETINIGVGRAQQDHRLAVANVPRQRAASAPTTGESMGRHSARAAILVRRMG